MARFFLVWRLRTIEPGQTVTLFVAVEGGQPEFERVFSGAGLELEQ